MTQGQIMHMQREKLQKAWADAQPALLLLANTFVKAGREANRMMAEAIEKQRTR